MSAEIGTFREYLKNSTILNSTEIGTFREWLRESTILNSTDYKIAKGLSALDKELDEYAYKYGDSDEEINKATSEKKWIGMKKDFNISSKEFKKKTKLEFNVYITKYEKQEAKGLKDITPNTTEGKMFKLAMNLKKDTGYTIIRPDGDYGEGLIMPFYEKDGDIFQKERFKADIKLDIDKKHIKNFIKCVNFYKDLVSYSNTPFRSIVSKNNKEARTEVDQIIKKYAPIVFVGFYKSPDNW
jgi:hypothetical protein